MSSRPAQERAAAGCVEQAIVGGGVLATEQVAAECREEAVDLAPREEAQSGEDHERHRRADVVDEEQDRQALEHQCNAQGILAAEVIRDPAEEAAVRPH